MPILGGKGLSGIVKRMLDVVFVGGLGIYLTLPILLKWYMGLLWKVNGEVDQYMTRSLGRTIENYYFLLGLLYVTGPLCLLIVYEMRRIFKTLNRRNPFMMDNVISLKHMSMASFAISAAYVVKIFFYNSFLTVIIAMVFLIAGLFALILSEVFRQAVEVKEENDLTI
jgi:hypothetical protein